MRKKYNTDITIYIAYMILIVTAILVTIESTKVK